MSYKNKNIIIVGAGIVNLVSAYFLTKQQYKLTIIDKAPNPLEKNDWKKQGCTFGGENVRMYTYTEADNYNEKNSQLYSKMNEAFENLIKHDGWLIRNKETLNEQERAWIEDFHAVDPEDAIQFGEDIYNVNIRSGALWDKWMEESPELFSDVEVIKGILRIYSDETHFEAAQQLHGRLNSMTHAMTMEEVLDQYPVFQKAHQTDMMGGCMTVKGFTLKVKDLCSNIIRFLMKNNAEFHWNTTFSGIQRNHMGKVEGIFINNELKRYDHYLISPGAYAGASLRNTHSANKLHGVLGVWLTIPNLYPELNYSMKIHKTGHVGEDTNVTLINQDSKPVLVLGSGYGYTGNSTSNHTRLDELEGIFKSLKHTAQTYFPEAYEAAKPYIDNTGRYCVRAWTPSGLGVFESIPAIDGGYLIITGGNNTGGFTQSTYIADAVISALAGQQHPMHALFHPKRKRKINYPL